LQKKALNSNPTPTKNLTKKKLNIVKTDLVTHRQAYYDNN
jgi:hypothetical protein